MTKYQGLNDQEVTSSRNAHGVNLLAEPPHQSVWELLREKFSDPLIIILAVAAFISILSGSFVEGAGILLAVVLAGGIGFLSEYKAGREFDILNRADDEVLYKVLRNGAFCNCVKSELVVGDLIFVETGEEIPADAQVLEDTDFYVDQSKFTGEPEPILKLSSDNPRCAEFKDSSYQADQVLRGSMVLSGNAYLKITAVGMATEIGKTARAATEITNNPTPLQKQLTKLSKIIAIFGFTLAALLFLILFTKAYLGNELANFPDHDTIKLLLNIFMIAVTLIVVTVPEGLPMSVTLSLAMSMRRMAKNNILIRKLHAAETIGAATVICTDKTGTLTMNQMHVVETNFPSGDDKLIEEAFSVNSSANLNGDEVIGNPTEGALLRYLSGIEVNYAAIRAAHGIKKQWPFTTEKKFMATLLDNGRIHFKGAPEVILSKSISILGLNGVEEINQTQRQTLLGKFQSAQAKGFRTLGFAYADCAQEDLNQTGLTFLGFVAIADPVRPDVPEAVKECTRARIKVKIITGDTAVTAGEIGRQIGLVQNQLPIEGRFFEALSDEACLTCSKELQIISRARPNDKMRLVKNLQLQHEVVAVTGDGTNDAPALHHADVGIAMGKTGTAIAREAADIILLDDSFRSIVNAVLWGRSLYLNIQKFLVFQLTINVAAAGIALMGPFVGVSMPLTVIQMLWINLIMDTFAALALATEPPTPEVMNQPPRHPDKFIISGKMALHIFGTGLLFMAIFFFAIKLWGDDGIDPRDLTIIFSSFVLLQFWNLLNVRAMGSNKSMILTPPDNPVFAWIAVVILGGQILITQFGGRMFRTEPLPLHDWLLIIGGTSWIFLLGEAVRFLRRTKNKMVS